jgi:hypothetical protein
MSSKQYQKTQSTEIIMGSEKSDQSKTGEELTETFRQRVTEQLQQLSERHDASTDKIIRLGNQLNDQLEQLSERHAAALHKLAALEAKLDEQTEQLSNRHAATQHKLDDLEQKLGSES